MKRDWTGNYNSIFKTLGASSHTDEERQPDDFYATDPIAIDLLLTKERPSCDIWECACGAGHLSQRLIEHGYIVYASDVKDRGLPFTAIEDFLKSSSLPIGFEECDILTNPPYKYAKEFILKSLELLAQGHKCYMLLKLTFLEGKARYRDLFSRFPPKSVYVFTDRLMCAKNGDFERMKAGGGSAVAYAWFVWEKGYTRPTQIDWI